jgi:hypothetical protein
MTRLFLFVSCLMIFLFPAQGGAWGSLTHAWLAAELGQGRFGEQELYGATAPDLFSVVLGSFTSDRLNHLSPVQPGQIRQEARKRGLDGFAFGFLVHNDRWGADFTAHHQGWTTPGRGYVAAKRDALALDLRPLAQNFLEEAGVPLASFWAGQLAPGLAEMLVESAIDLLVRRNEAPWMGEALTRSADERPAGVPDLMVRKYGKTLAKEEGISLAEAGRIIREAEDAFRKNMADYGRAMAFEESQAIAALAAQGAALLQSYLGSLTGREISVPPQLLIDCLNLALPRVEADYSAELDATLSGLGKKGPIRRYLSRSPQFPDLSR